MRKKAAEQQAILDGVKTSIYDASMAYQKAGTPLITYEGVRAIGALAKAFPGIPVLADYKMMDGVRKYVVETANQIWRGDSR